MTVRTPRIRQAAETCQVSHALAHEVISRYGEWTANQATSATQPTTVSYLGIIEFSNGTPSYGLNERQPLEAQYAAFASDYGYDIELARTVLAAYANTIIRELATSGRAVLRGIGALHVSDTGKVRFNRATAVAKWEGIDTTFRTCVNPAFRQRFNDLQEATA